MAPLANNPPPIHVDHLGQAHIYGPLPPGPGGQQQFENDWVGNPGIPEQLGMNQEQAANVQAFIFGPGGPAAAQPDQYYDYGDMPPFPPGYWGHHDDYY
jgi:hypothetical protein